jgi:hypothetical protein
MVRLESVQIGVGRVDVNPEEAGDGGGGDPGRVEYKGFGTATLPRL